jgi:hypothetical protein
VLWGCPPVPSRFRASYLVNRHPRARNGYARHLTGESPVHAAPEGVKTALRSGDPKCRRFRGSCERFVCATPEQAVEHAQAHYWNTLPAFERMRPKRRSTSFPSRSCAATAPTKCWRAWLNGANEKSGPADGFTHEPWMAGPQSAHAQYCPIRSQRFATSRSILRRAPSISPFMNAPVGASWRGN